jgi:hypothetical protein
MTSEQILIRVARMLLRRVLRKPLADGLPRVFKLLDEKLPRALTQQVAPVIIEGIIGDSITRATGIHPTAVEIQAVAALFDPLAAAVPFARRHQ